MSRGNHLSGDALADLAMQLTEGQSVREAIEHISGCVVCEQRFREMAGDWELSAVRVEEILGRQSTAVEEQTSGLWQRLRTWFASPRLRWAVAAAAVVALLISIVPRLTDTASDVNLSMLPPLTPDVLPRAVLPGGDNDELLKGLDAYAHKDFEAAISALEPIDTSGPADALRRVYLASALAWAGRHEQAVETLDDAPLDAVPEPWSSEAMWTLYLSLTETGQLDRAQSVLLELAEIPGEAGDRARLVLDEQSTR